MSNALLEAEREANHRQARAVEAAIEAAVRESEAGYVTAQGQIAQQVRLQESHNTGTPTTNLT